MLKSMKEIKDKSSKPKNKKKRNIILQSYQDIKDEIRKENKENISNNSLNTSLKPSFNSPIKPPLTTNKFKFSYVSTPIISKNKKIILITQNKYDKALHTGKSPFFISDKINFRNEFKSSKLVNDVKPKHLGLCDYYSKNNKKMVIINEEKEEETLSKTPRFHMEGN